MRSAMLAALSLTACASPSSVPTTTTPVRAPKEPSTVSAAPSVRWLVGPITGDAVVGQVTIDGRLLTITSAGLRALGKDGAPPTTADGLLDDHLFFGLVNAEKEFAFFGQFGTFVTGEPLGMPTRRLELPGGRSFRTGASGKRAFIGITPEGEALRSVDLGASWKPLAKSVVGVARSVAMNEHGRGLLLTVPQTVWLTDDDGVGWRKLASTGNGVEEVRTGPKGELFTVDGAQIGTPSVLEGNQLVSRGLSSRPRARFVLGQAYSGDRILRVAGDKEGIAVAIHAAGEEPVYTRPTGLSECDRLVGVAAYGKTFYVSCGRPERAGHDGSTELWRRDGESNGRWKPDGAPTGGDADLMAGPDGLLLSGSRLRPAHAGEWKDLEFSSVHHALVHGELLHLVAERDEVLVYAALKLDGSKVRESKLGSKKLELPTLSVRGDKVVVFGTAGGKTFSFDTTSKSETLEPAPLPEGTPTGLRHVLLHGARGIAHGRECGAFETDDGGKTWRDTKSSLSRVSCESNLADGCFEDGCFVGGNVRLGWEAKTPVQAPTQISASLPVVATPTHTPIELECVADGMPTEANGVLYRDEILPRSVAFGPRVGWAAVTWLGNGKVEIVRRRWGEKLEQHAALSKNAKQDIADAIEIGPSGIVVARETVGSGTLAAEITALRWSETRPWRTRVKNTGKPDANGLARERPTVLSLDEESLHYRSSDASAPVLALAPGNKRSEIPVAVLRAGIPTQFVQLQSGPALFDNSSYFVKLASKVRTARWNLDGDSRLGDWQGRPALGLDIWVTVLGENVARSFAVPLSDAFDPDGVIEIDHETLIQGLSKACAATDAGGVVVSLKNAGRVNGTRTDEPLDADAFVRVRAGQPACLVAWLAGKSFLRELVVISGADPQKADRVLLEGSGTAQSLSVTPTRCSRR